MLIKILKSFVLVTNMDSNITLSSRDDIKLISSPDWPDPYPNDATVVMEINSPENTIIKLTVLDLELERPCGNDNLLIIDGNLTQRKYFI